MDLAGRGQAICVPALWFIEVAHSVLVLVRRGSMSDAERVAALGWLAALPVEIDQQMAGIAWTTLYDLAAEHRLSLYDATYLELAKRRACPLATRDKALAAAARTAGVQLWE